MNKLLLLIILVALAGGVYFGAGELKKNELEKNAVSVVNQILENDFITHMFAKAMDAEVAKCTRVSIVEKIGSNTYTGVAILDNGSILNVKIQDLGDSMTVEITD